MTHLCRFWLVEYETNNETYFVFLGTKVKCGSVFTTDLCEFYNKKQQITLYHHSYSDVIASQLHIGDSMTMAGVASGEAAVLTHCCLLGLTVVQPVLIMLRAGPGFHCLRLHQQVPQGGTRLLQVCLDMRLATRGIAAQADFNCWEWRATAAQDALQCWRSGLFHAQGVVLLHYVRQFVVLLQIGLLRVSMIAFGAAGQCGVFGPGLADAAPAEVVLAGQLDGI